MRHRKRLTLIITTLLLALLVLGCDISDQFYGFEKRDAEQNAKETQAIEDRLANEKAAKEALDNVEEGVDRSEGNYKLTFSGPENRTGTDFDALNRTPALFSGGGALTAHENVKYSVGVPEAPTPAKSEYRFNAIRTGGGNELSGSLKVVRTIGPNPYSVITNADTGETRVEKNPRPDPATVVTWEGEVSGRINPADGSIQGTVKGTMSNNDGFSKEFIWDFTGEKTK